MPLMTGLVSCRAIGLYTRTENQLLAQSAHPIHKPLIPSIIYFNTPTAHELRTSRAAQSCRLNGFTVAPWTLKEHRRNALSGRILQVLSVYTFLNTFRQAYRGSEQEKTSVSGGFYTLQIDSSFKRYQRKCKAFLFTTDNGQRPYWRLPFYECLPSSCMQNRYC